MTVVAAPRRRTSARRLPLALLVTAILLAIAVVVSILLGTRVLSAEEIVGGLLGHDEVAAAVIWQLRLPRTLVGLLAGAALGMAGVLAQSVTRNPLADPGLLGISAGAAVAVVFGSAVLGLGAGTARVGLALAGAALATLAVYVISQRSPDGLTPVNMTLAGMAITAFLGAAVSGIVLMSARTMDQYRFWVVGALTVPDPGMLVAAVAPALIGAILALAVSGSLDAIALGDDTAAALGVKVQPTRLLSGAAVVLLSGTAVAIAGPIVFIGLAIPHMARALVGTRVRRVLAMSALLGPLLLLAADILGRIVVRPSELQVGVVTAVLGTPLFIWLTRRKDAR